MGREHIMPADRVHYRWDNSIRPVLEIEPGDVVTDGVVAPDTVTCITPGSDPGAAREPSS